MTARTMGILAVSLVVLLGRATFAVAQCGSWSCSGANLEWTTGGNPGRMIIQRTTGLQGSTGLRFDYNGQPEWSIRTLSFESLEFYNDRTSTLAMVLGNGGGGISARHVIPFSHNAYDLGSSTRRWLRLYVGSVNQSSDRRMKNDIETLRHGLAEVLRLRPVTFRWANGQDSSRQIGLIAQEVQEVLPEIVSAGKAADEPLSLAYTDLVPVLINAVQAQQETIEQDAARIVTLEGRRTNGSALSSPGTIGAGIILGLLPGLGAVVIGRRRRNGARRL